MAITIPDRENRDSLFFDAAYFIIEKNEIRPGQLQIKFRLGYNRANKILKQLVDAGIVSEDLYKYKANVNKEEMLMAFHNTSHIEEQLDKGLLDI
ncbi:DNA translocase FtsK [Flavobacterium beibuense]|uniref:DNA translocase FtsK n=1 Tax=Flavobacterium beibuense TaxID=657326 RepID=UPI003A93D52E